MTDIDYAKVGQVCAAISIIIDNLGEKIVTNAKINEVIRASEVGEWTVDGEFPDDRIRQVLLVKTLKRSNVIVQANYSDLGRIIVDRIRLKQRPQNDSFYWDTGIRSNNIHIIEALFAQNYVPENIDNDLMALCKQRYSAPLVKLLLDNGANITDDLLYHTLEVDTVRLLISAGADVDGNSGYEDKYYNPMPILHAIIHDGIEINKHSTNEKFQLFLSEFATQQDISEDTAEYIRIHLAIVEVLIDAGVDVNMQMSRGETPLHLTHTNTELAHMLLDAGADPTILDSADATPIFYTSSIAMINILIEAGVDLDVRDISLRTVLHNNFGNIDVIETLIEGGANVNTYDVNGETVLHRVSISGNRSIKLLIDAKADVNAKNPYGDTPLMYAIEHHNVNGIRRLLEGGANINTQNTMGDTPLHIAHASLVKMLLDRGAYINIRNYTNETALDVARKIGDNEKVAILEEAMRAKRQKRG